MGEQIGELAHAALLESGALKAENATLRAQLAAATQDRDRAAAENAKLEREVSYLKRAREIQREKSTAVLRSLIGFVIQSGGDVEVSGECLAQAFAPGVFCQKTDTENGVRLVVTGAALAAPPAQLTAAGQQQDEAAAAAQRLREACKKAVRLILEADATTEESNYARVTAHIRILLCAALATPPDVALAELQAKAQGAADERERWRGRKTFRLRYWTEHDPEANEADGPFYVLDGVEYPSQITAGAWRDRKNGDGSGPCHFQVIEVEIGERLVRVLTMQETAAQSVAKLRALPAEPTPSEDTQ